MADRSVMRLAIEHPKSRSVAVRYAPGALVVSAPGFSAPTPGIGAVLGVGLTVAANLYAVRHQAERC